MAALTRRSALANLAAGVALQTAARAQTATQTPTQTTPQAGKDVAPVGIAPGSIDDEDVPYPYPVQFLPLTLYGQDVQIRSGLQGQEAIVVAGQNTLRNGMSAELAQERK